MRRCPPVRGNVTYLLSFHRFQLALKKQCVGSSALTSFCWIHKCVSFWAFVCVCVCKRQVKQSQTRPSRENQSAQSSLLLHHLPTPYHTHPHIHTHTDTQQVTRQKEEDSVSSYFLLRLITMNNGTNYELANASVNWSKQSAIVPHSFFIVSLQRFCPDWILSWNSI